MSFSPASRRSISSRKISHHEPLSVNRSFAFTPSERKLHGFIKQKSADLLDVASSIPNRRLFNPGQELSDVSLQLVKLRKSLDEKRQIILVKDKSISIMKKDMNLISDIKSRKLPEIETVSTRLKMLENKLAEAKIKCEHEETNFSANLHLLERMRTTMFYLEKKEVEYREAISAQSNYLQYEVNKCEKSKESKLQSKSAFEKLQTSLMYGKKENDETKYDIQKASGNLEKTKMRREAVKRRQKEFLDNEMIKDQISQLQHKHESLMSFRFFYNLITFQYEKQMEFYQKLEDCYLKMKAASGISEIDLMINRCYTREHDYKELITLTNAKKSQLEASQKKIVAIEADIEELNKLKNSCYLNEFNESAKQKEISDLRLSIKRLKTKRHNLMKIANKLKIWTKKTSEKIDSVVEKNFFITGLSSENFENCADFLIKIRNEVRNALKNLQSPKETVQDFIWKMRSKSISSIIDEIPASQCRSIMVEEEFGAEDLDGYVSPDTGKHSENPSRKKSLGQFSYKRG
ncbi:unnamed protein product [Blepharisma stoltei]|uniref:Uncharacterized protein n=1 Tax=Blepharisma stoltei TaxID=1481888 RepID=A0AAU9K3E6_9CILI|nr:unnamed protein product [Blepharisma stoltei]